MSLKLVKPGDTGSEPLYPEWFLVATPWTCYTVSVVMARSIERALARWPRPRWVSFVDLAGARMRLRSDTIIAVEQCSPDSRANWRRFREEREAEEPDKKF